MSSRVHSYMVVSVNISDYSYYDGELDRKVNEKLLLGWCISGSMSCVPLGDSVVLYQPMVMSAESMAIAEMEMEIGNG